MLSSLTFAKDHRCFKADTRLDFRPGINFLVGDQGAGKSSVISLMRGMGGDRTALGPMTVEDARKTAALAVDGKNFKFFGFDFEKDNPRMLPHLTDKHMMFQIGSYFRSHGETVRAILSSLEENAVKERYLVLFDEPDVGLSPRSIVDLLRVMRVVADNGGQVVASVHNPILMLGVPEVLSLEHRRWMTGRDFLAQHGVTGL